MQLYLVEADLTDYDQFGQAVVWADSPLDAVDTVYDALRDSEIKPLDPPVAGALMPLLPHARLRATFVPTARGVVMAFGRHG